MTTEENLSDYVGKLVDIYLSRQHFKTELLDIVWLCRYDTEIFITNLKKHCFGVCGKECRDEDLPFGLQCYCVASDFVDLTSI